ncbi:hypothetical protein LLUC320_13265 (plasmid) [Lactococcus cremoris]|uniref:hypothetical protein n=1 Tax=Lactococcus TaxID=1357 RepID=UPI00223B3E64|nr:hypothetical protein [Lactococcus cremoris]MCT0458423.1 hypothetical protein [Lactococcus cremoris]
MRKYVKNGGIIGIITGAVMTLAALGGLMSIEEQVERYPIPNVNSILVRLLGIIFIALALTLLYYCTKVFEQIQKDKSTQKLSTVFLTINGVMLLVGNTTILDAGIPGAIIFFNLIILISGILGIIGGVMYLINLKNIS